MLGEEGRVFPLLDGLSMTTKSRSELLGGRYRLQRQIGSGGMAGVYLARDERLGRDVAVKLTDPARDVGGQSAARIEQEARRVARLNHPNIVQVHDVGTTDDDAYIVMELVQGLGLDEVIREDGPLSEAEAARIAREVCHGLAAAHAAGVVHQDIKPSNLLVDGDGRVRIADFGVARAHDGDTLTAEQPFGSAPYVSPEQVEGRRTDHRSDLYSLGVVLYEMLTGRRPFRGDSMASTVMQRLHQDPEPPSRWADVSPEVEKVVLRALARDPDDRFHDAEAMSAALRSAVPEDGGAGEGDRTVPLPVRPPLDRTVRRGALLLVALATLAVAGWAVSSSLAPAPTTASVVAVPDVSDMTVGVASRVLAANDLQVGDITMDLAPAAALGTVLVQFPAPGSEIDPGGTVHLIVAGGSPAPASGPGSPEPDGGATGGDSGADRSDAPAADGADSQEEEATSDEPASSDGPTATDPPGHGGTPPGHGGDPPGKGRP